MGETAERDMKHAFLLKIQQVADISEACDEWLSMRGSWLGPAGRWKLKSGRELPAFPALAQRED